MPRLTRARVAFVVLVAVALVPGLLHGHPWPALAIAFGLALAWQAWPRQGAAGTPRVAAHSGHARQRTRRLLRLLRTYRHAATTLPDAIVVLESDTQRVCWFNEAATRLLGLQAPRDLARPLRELLDSPMLAAWLDAGAGEPLLDLPSPSGSRLHLALRRFDPDDAFRMLLARDVSKLTRLEQTRRDFVANVSHELRTPLTVLHGYLDLLDPEELPELAPMLREMRAQSHRMGRIVEDLLMLSRLEVQETVADEVIAMRPLLAALQREAQAVSGGQHRVELLDEAGCDLLGSAKELHSAFSNLVSNAVRYTPAGGLVRIGFRRDAGGACLYVSDSGHGIPAQHVPRITERFYRVSTSRSRETGGTGLGLSIVKHVLHLHQARLSIDSEVGRGSTFACHFAADRVLPRDDDDAELA